MTETAGRSNVGWNGWRSISSAEGDGNIQQLAQLLLIAAGLTVLATAGYFRIFP